MDRQDKDNGLIKLQAVINETKKEKRKKKCYKTLNKQTTVVYRVAPQLKIYASPSIEFIVQNLIFFFRDFVQRNNKVNFSKDSYMYNIKDVSPKDY